MFSIERYDFNFKVIDRENDRNSFLEISIAGVTV